jgi:uncharacterized protein (TIGR02646 family)
MLPIDRQSVPRPAKLDSLSREHPPRTELQRARDHFSRPSPGKFTFSIYSDPEVKAALSKLTGGKCAYCEHLYDVGQPGDVEHYRPKGRIDTAVGKLRGYWWLASDWDNLLPSCLRCNRPENLRLHGGEVMAMGKGERFPIDDEAARAREEGEHVNETPLLLDPCVHDPRDYIRFEEKDGWSVVRPKTDDQSQLAGRRARTSIDIYGLNREGLVNDRTREMVQIKSSLVALATLIELLDQDPPNADAIETLILLERQRLDRYRSKDGPYTAMARTLIDPVLERIDPAFAAQEPLLEYRWP